MFSLRGLAATVAIMALLCAVGAQQSCLRQVAAWGQCGGLSCPWGPGVDGVWSGTCCRAGYFCQRKDQWFHQCVQGTSGTKPPAPPTPAPPSKPGLPPAPPVPPASTSPPPAPTITPNDPPPAAFNMSKFPLPAVSKLYARPAPKISAQVNLLPSRKGPLIPQSFFGLSIEWNGIPILGQNKQWIQAMKVLQQYGTGPVNIRVGGGSTDKLRDVPSADTWNALKAMRTQLGSKFILGLPFESGDMALARRHMSKAQEQLAGSIETFEIGNEPNFYINKNGMDGGAYVACCFVNEWSRFAGNLSCPAGSAPSMQCAREQFAGPVWGHINMFPSTMNWFLSATWKYVNMATLHWYKATSQDLNTPQSLLHEDQIRQEVANLQHIVAVAGSFGKPLRVAEMNSISNSGRTGVSDVFASALWTLDTALEAASSGAVGVNLHQGSGQNLYTSVVAGWAGGDISVRPSFYGQLTLQMALGRGSRLVGRQAKAPPSLKVFPLESVSDGVMRVVVINKNDTDAAAIVLNLPGSYGAATVTRLVAAGASPVAAKGGITLGGVAYGAGMQAFGAQTTEKVPGWKTATGAATYRLYMPPGSAAIVTVAPGTVGKKRKAA